MAKFFDELNDKLIRFIEKQKIFFVATSPEEGRISLSPKGMETFCVVDKNTAAYMDLTGSGNETAAQLHQNPRITMMFCSFDKEPLILRLYGKARVINQYHDDWSEWASRFKPYPGQRQIMLMTIDSVQTSCGFGVPIADNMQERDVLEKWAANKQPEKIQQYWVDKNQESIDGLPTHILAKADTE